MGEEDTPIYISVSKLCEYLNTADSKGEQVLSKQVYLKKVKKRKRSETPTKEIRASNKASYTKQEGRVAKRADYDIDYE